MAKKKHVLGKTYDSSQISSSSCGEWECVKLNNYKNCKAEQKCIGSRKGVSILDESTDFNQVKQWLGQAEVRSKEALL